MPKELLTNENLQAKWDIKRKWRPVEKTWTVAEKFRLFFTVSTLIPLVLTIILNVLSNPGSVLLTGQEHAVFEIIAVYLELTVSLPILLCDFVLMKLITSKPHKKLMYAVSETPVSDMLWDW